MNKNWFIPNFEDKEKNTRAVILVYSILLGITLLLVSSITNVIFDVKSDFPFLMIALCMTVLLIMFRYTRSFVLVGNILGLVICVSIFGLSATTGGIFSEDTHSLYMVPLIVFLVAGMKSAIFWFVISISLTCFNYSLADTDTAIEFYREQTLQFGKEYYFFLSLTNISLISITLGIFSLQYKKLLKNLEKKKEDLELQKSKLQKTQVQLKASNKELDQYAYTTAHDLKQPIRTIHSFSGLLAKELKKPDAKDQKIEEYLNVIHKSSSNMNQLVTDLLEYSQFSTDGKNKITKVLLPQIVENVKINLRDLIDTSNTELRIDELPEVMGYAIQLTQLFQNLISNAIKFQHSERSPVIKITSKKTSTHYVISVEDNGIGMEQSNLKAIFNPFKKLNSSREYEGSGIGLATCTKIIELHDGQISVDSKEGVGSIFTFTLPITLV